MHSVEHFYQPASSLGRVSKNASSLAWLCFQKDASRVDQTRYQNSSPIMPSQNPHPILRGPMKG